MSFVNFYFISNKYFSNQQVYYDTPYDRHVILEESHDVRYRKRNSKGLEDPPGLGSRILRRLSSKTKDQSPPGVAGAASAGVDNRGFQKDVVPNSPWRYPFRRNPVHPGGLTRTISQDSASSISSVAALPPQPPSMHKVALSRMLP